MINLQTKSRPGRSVVRSVLVRVIRIFGVMLISTIRFLLIIGSDLVRFLPGSDRI